MNHHDQACPAQYAFLLAAALLLPLTSCNATHAPAAAPGSGARADSARTLRLADAVPLRALRGPVDDVDLAYKLTPPAVQRTLYFGTLSPAGAALRTADRKPGKGKGGPNDENAPPKPPATADDEQRAIIATHAGRNWEALAVGVDSIPSPGWSYVAGGPKGGEVWAVMESSDEEDPCPDLALLHSTDDGETWSLTVVHKDQSAATFNDFCVGPDGHGRLTLHLDAQPGDGKKEKARPGGYFHYQTTDDGKTWQAPTREPDSTTPADDVPDEEQPKSDTTVARGGISSGDLRVAS